MASVLTMTPGVKRPSDYMCLDQELTEQNIPVVVGNKIMVNGMAITLDPEFEDQTTLPCNPVKTEDTGLVNTILKNQSDSAVASACATYLEKMNDYMCAESALKEQRLDAVNIEVTSWVDKKKAVDSNGDSSSTQKPFTTENSANVKSAIQANVLTVASMNSSGNSVSLLRGNNKRLYRCSRCSFTHSELKEVAAHQATFHLPEKKNTGTTSGNKVAINISKVQCPHCSQKHIIGRYSCRNCSFETMCPMELEHHMWEIHKSMHVYHCPCCKYISQTYMHIENHLVEFHALGTKVIVTPSQEGVEKPKEPEKTIEENDPVEVVNNDNPTRYSLMCSICQFYTNCQLDFSVHISKYHNRFSCMPFMCLLCGKETFNKRGLELHSKNRHKNEPQSFALNNNSRKTMIDLTDLKMKEFLKIVPKDMSTIEEKSLQWWCLVCGSGPQPYVYHLTPHIASHLCYAPYSCSECRMQFKLQLLANNHLKESTECWNKHATIKINTYLKKLQMADIEILRKDVQLVDGTAKREARAVCDSDLPYLCQICHYASKTSSVLTQHMYLHLQLKPHKCPVPGCGYAYPYKQGCMVHIKKSHGDEKGQQLLVDTDYGMILEQKKLAQALMLENTIHLPTTIVQNKCYRELEQCTLCGFGPCGKAGLSIHMAFHSPYMPYKCGKCSARFKQNLVASIHAVETHHSSDLIIDHGDAVLQQGWVQTAVKMCTPITPEYSLKPIPKTLPVGTPATIPPKALSPIAAYSLDEDGNVLPPSTSRPISYKDGKIAQVFKCKDCGFYSATFSNLKNHVISSHLPQKPYRCAVCGAAYRSAMFCGKHLHSHGNEFGLKKHMVVLDIVLAVQTKAANDMIEEVTCTDDNKAGDLLASNTKLKPSRKPAPASEIPVTEESKSSGPKCSSKSKPTLPTPTQNHFRCTICKDIFMTRRHARQHFLLKHAKITPYSCTYCSFESTFRQFVRDHVTKEHPELEGRSDVVFVTEVKEQTLKRSLDAFLNHSHRTVNPRRGQLLKGNTVNVPDHYKAMCITSSGRSCIYRCSHSGKCSYTARSIEAFKKHVQDHLDIEQYRCIHCSYSNDKNIYRHIRNIHGSKDEDVVETKAYILLVTQMEDLAREVLVLDEKFHTEGDDVPETGFPTTTQEYTCVCQHCQEQFPSLVAAKKHHSEAHSSKQLMVDVDLNFTGASVDQQVKPNEDDDDGDNLEEFDDAIAIISGSKLRQESDDALLAKRIKLEPKGVKVNIDVGCNAASATQFVEQKRNIPKTNTVIKVLYANKRKGLVQKKQEYMQHYHMKKENACVNSASAQPACPGGLLCHLCGTTLVHFHSLKRHFVVVHTGLRPYQCDLCDFSSHERYEVKRHAKNKHDGTAMVRKAEKDARMALKAMKNFLADWRSAEAARLKKLIQPDDPKLEMIAVVKLEDISKNPDLSKYFQDMFD